MTESTANSDQAITRRIEDLPVFTEIDDPNFGQDWNWIADDLFQRPYQGPYRHETFGLVIYRNADIHELGTHPDVSHAAAVPGFQDGLMEFSTFAMRPPVHKTAKSLVSRQVSGKKVQGFADAANEVAQSMLTKVVDRGEVDLVSQYMRPFLGEFWSRVFGCPVEDMERVQHLIDEMQLAFSLFPSEEDFARSDTASEEYLSLITAVIDRGIARGDLELLNGLVADFQKLDEADRPSNVASHFGVALLDAFNTAGALAVNAVGLVVAVPERYDVVRGDRALVSSAWLEASRLRPPVIATQRAPMKDIVHDGLLIPAETPLTMLWLFGNRDPELFEDPNAYQLERENRAQQTNFGVGVYACLGRHVARLLGETVLSTLTDPGLEVVPTAPAEYSRGGLVQEPVRLTMTVRSVPSRATDEDADR